LVAHYLVDILSLVIKQFTNLKQKIEKHPISPAQFNFQSNFFQKMHEKFCRSTKNNYLCSRLRNLCPGHAAGYIAHNEPIKPIYETMDLIKVAEQAFASGKEHPEFGPGDTITVAYRIKEGNKERIQQYRGVVIKIVGEGNKKRFTVRKISDNIGVERIFPLNSPFIDAITVNKYGKVRRAKLYYLRALTGKKARIKERRVVAKN